MGTVLINSLGRQVSALSQVEDLMKFIEVVIADELDEAWNDAIQSMRCNYPNPGDKELFDRVKDIHNLLSATRHAVVVLRGCKFSQSFYTYNSHVIEEEGADVAISDDVDSPLSTFIMQLRNPVSPAKSSDHEIEH